MPTITKTVRVVSRGAKRTAPGTERLWRAIEIEFATGQVEWVVSHTASIAFLPAGSSVSGARLIEQSDYSRNCGYLSGKATISSPSYTILDADNALSNEIATKLVNGIGTYNRVIREYEWDAGTALPLSNGSPRFAAKGTWLFRDHKSKDYGTIVTINCADINRGLDAEVFNPMKWTLDHTVQATNDEGEYLFTAGQTTFTTNISAADFTANPELYWRPFEHGDHYTEQPGQTGTYMLLEPTGQNGKRKETIWASNMRVDGGRVVFDAVRAQLLTTAQEFTVSSSTTSAQGPRTTEWIYFDEIVTTAFRGLIVGDFNGRALPSHWTVAAPDFWVDKVSIAQAGEELTVEFQNPGKTKLKAFLEKEILPVTLSVAPVNNVGALAYRRHEIAIDVGQSTAVFNESNCNTDKTYTLRHKKDQIYSAIRIEYNWDPHSKEFLSETIYYAPDSASFNQINRTKTIQLKGLTSAALTDEIIRRLGGLHGNAHFYEQQEITIESYVNDIPLGEVIYVNFTKPIVIDDANGTSTAQPLKRAFTVIAAKETRNTTTYTLRGTLEKATDFIKTTQQFNLDTDSVVNTQSGAVDITTGVNAGAIALNVGEFHYFKGNLTVPNTTTITPIGNSNKPTILFVEGFFDCSANIDLSGRGARRIADGATALVDANDGEVGFVGGQDSTYGYEITNHTRIQGGGTTDFGNSEGNYISSGKFSLKAVQRNLMAKARSDVFGITVTNVDGRIEGIPTSLTGSSGAGAPRSVLLPYLTGDTDSPVSTAAQYIDGSNGGQTGGAFIIISRGGVMNGVVNTSGTEGAAPNFITFAGQKFYGAKGGSGEPSPWIWIIDGNHTRPIINSTNFHAYLPHSGYVDGRYPQPADYVSFDGANPVHPNVPVNNDPAGTNLWATRHQIINIGESQSLQRLPVYESSATEQAEQIINFLESQTDGEVVLYIGNTDPSNGNVGDMVITQANIDSNVPRPPFRYLTDTGWQDYNWSSGPNASVYAGLIYINRTYGANKILVSTTRPTEFEDGDIWFNPETDLSYILSSDGNDTIYDLGQIQAGGNLYRDGRFTLQRQFGNEWVFLDEVLTLPTLFGGGAITGTVSGTGQLPEPTVSVTAYSATQAEVIIGEPADLTSVTGFEVRRDGTLIATLAVGNNSYLDNALSATTSYTYTVRTIGGATASNYVSQTITTPAAGGGGGGGGVTLTPPSNFNAVVNSQTYIELQWTPSPDTNVTGYRIIRDGVILGIASGRTTTSYQQTGLTAGTTYVYQIAATDGNGNFSSTLSYTATTNSVVLDPPTNFQAASAGQTSVNLTWTATTDTDVTGYEILRDGVSIANVTPRTTSSYTDTGLTAGTAYNYTLRSTDGGGNQSGNVTASATTDSAPTLGTVTNFTNAVYGPTSGELLWTPATDTDVTGYRIFRNGTLIATKNGRTTSSHYMDDMTANTTYTYTIRSIDAGGNESAPLTTTMTTNP